MQSVTSLVDKVTRLIINPIILVVFTFGFVVFLYGLVEFMWALSKGGDQKSGKQHMLWGVIGMFIMVSVYGIISLIDSTIGSNVLSGGGTSTYQVPSTGAGFQ